MVLVAIIAILLLAVAIGCGFVAVSDPRIRRAEKLRLIDVYGYSAAREEAIAGGQTRRTLDVFASAIGDFLGSRLSSLREDETQRRLLAAGFYRVGARRFLGYRVLLTLGVPILLLWLLLLAGAPTGEVVLFVVVGVCFGWFGPTFYLGRRTKSRIDEIDYSMPELIDLLAVILEAGVAFSAGMRIAGERISGPLGEELRLTIQEQSLGLSTLDALDNWRTRCAAATVQTFVRSMVQGDGLGISVGQILRNLAIEMRKRRQQAAEERAHKAAIKILFPLALLIFPAMFVIILGPALFKIADTLAH